MDHQIKCTSCCGLQAKVSIQVETVWLLVQVLLLPRCLPGLPPNPLSHGHKGKLLFLGGQLRYSTAVFMLRVLISPKYFWAYLYAQIKWLSFLVGRPGIRTNRPLGLFLTLTKCFVFQIIRPHPGLCSKHSIIFPFTAFLYLSWLPQFVATLPTVVCNIWVKHELSLWVVMPHLSRGALRNPRWRNGPP